MILEKAEELGIEFEPLNDEEFAPHRSSEDEFIKNQDLTKLAEKYWKDTRKTLKAKDEWLIFSLLAEEAQNAQLSIIYWYQFFISAKIQCGLHGVLDFDGNLDDEELTDTQSDATGSIKIALIAVERSIMAWTNLMTKKIPQPSNRFWFCLKQSAEKPKKNFRTHEILFVPALMNWK